jgi:nitroreductase
MNPELSLIFRRRSIRAYAPGSISEEIVRDILEAAMAAPSACAKDPWHFVVVRERSVLESLAAGLPNGKMLADAALGIVASGSIEEAHDGQLSYLLQDVSASIQNLLLAASALGLGACWLGVHPREDRTAHVRRLLGLAPTIIPVGIVALGRPGERKEPRTRYQESKVHRERW